MSEKVANPIALAVAIAVLVFGALVAVKPATDHWHELTRDPFAHETTTQTVTKTEAHAKKGAREGKATTTTVKDRERSALDRAFDQGGVLLLRIGLATAAAFLAGAFVQRILMGEYALELGPVKIPALQKAAATLDALAEEVARLKLREKETRERLKAVEGLTGTTYAAVQDVARRMKEPDSAP